jgi:hypothetical protein
LQYREAEALQSIGERRANTGVILVIACTLDLERFAVQKETLVGIEDCRAGAAKLAANPAGGRTCQ